MEDGGCFDYAYHLHFVVVVVLKSSPPSRLPLSNTFYFCLFTCILPLTVEWYLVFELYRSSTIKILNYLKVDTENKSLP